MQTEIDKALATLKQGGIILYPCDTIWGIGCDATNTCFFFSNYLCIIKRVQQMKLFFYTLLKYLIFNFKLI